VALPAGIINAGSQYGAVLQALAFA
jgi:hypothetical protein